MKKLTREELRRRFEDYNSRYFDGVLPPCDVSVKKMNFFGEYHEWEGARGKRYRKITLATNIDWTEETLREVILHEMIHCYVRTIDGCRGIDGFSLHGLYGHGKRFSRQCRRIKKEYGIDIHRINYNIYRREEKVPTTWLGKIRRRMSYWLAN